MNVKRRFAEQFQLRMPDGLRDRISAVSKKSGKSMNLLIVEALEEAYPDSKERLRRALAVIDEAIEDAEVKDRPALEAARKQLFVSLWFEPTEDAE